MSYLSPLNPPIRNWRDQRVWLVGASSGIGLALAERLHSLGAKVIVSARQQDALETFVKQHPNSQAYVMDVSYQNEIQHVAQQILKEGPLDLLCYCAGYYRPMRATAVDLPDMLRHHDINVLGALRVLHAVAPSMLRRGQGHLSWVSSVAGFRGLPQSLAYGPTKAALIHLAETLYLDLHPHGLGVSVINPGFVKTPLTAQNQFRMPALISTQEAAQAIVRGWERGIFEIHFPKRFTHAMKLLRILPYRMYFSAVRRFTGV